MPKRNSLFVDTSGWAYLLISNDPLHQAVQAAYNDAVRRKRPIVTTNMVLAELVPLLDSRARIARQRVLAYVDTLRAAPHVTIYHIDEATDQEAWDKLKHFRDKEWSVVDAASFVVMRRHSITEALTTDHHFEQAGFARVPQA